MNGITSLVSNSNSFSLEPLAPFSLLPELTVTGTLTRQDSNLDIRYALSGDLEAVALPAPTDIPARRHGLWRETCFEFFLGLPGAPGYWEFNLSPAGHWNVYGFTAYRQGMAEEMAIVALPFSLRRRSDSLSLALEFDLTRIIPADRLLEVGITAVVKLRDGQATYWALSHPGREADFHRRDGFVLTI